MIIDWLERHYYYFVALLLLIAVVKVLSASTFLRREDGINGMFVVLFRWFSSLDYHVSNTPWKLRNRKFLNGITLLFYCTFVLFIFITFMIKLFR
jgi:hypothetical protein